MNRYAIDLAYKGTNYHGWQRQLNAKSVQQELEDKLSVVLRTSISTVGCGRTDTGVHAKQFVAHFNCDTLFDNKLVVYKLNGITNPDLVIYNIRPVSADFNARFDAKFREYEYVLLKVQDPFLFDYAYYFSRSLDIDLMNKACAMLIGNKDFECFSKVNTQVNNFNCDVMLAEWLQVDNRLVFTIRANRFLRNMVRAIVGTLIDVGLHKITLDDFSKILESKKRCEAGASVPAKGLFLTRVVY